jgi:hypothetical protein
MSVATNTAVGRLGNVPMDDVIQETRRRQRATVTGGASTLDDDTEYSRPFRTDDQHYVVWNMAHRGLRPRSLRAAFRILGLFPSTEEAISHAQMVAELDSTCDLRVIGSHEWYAIPRTAFTDVAPHTAKVNRNLLLHQQMLQEHATEFTTRKAALTKGRTPAYEQVVAADRATERRLTQTQQRAEALEAGETEMHAQADREVAQAEAELALEMSRRALAEETLAQQGTQDDAAEEAEFVDTPLVSKPPAEVVDEQWEEELEKSFGTDGLKIRSLNRLAEVRNQRFAVVSVVEDYEDGDEPGLIVWAAFETESEALKYNKCVAAKHLRDHDLAVVSMYEWVYPHLLGSDRVEQMYRNEELNNIMKHSRTSSQRVRDFERECADEGLEVPTMEIEADLAAPAPICYNPAGFDDAESALNPAVNIENVEVPADIGVGEFKDTEVEE